MKPLLYRLHWDALSCIHGCDPVRYPVVGIYVLKEGCVVYRTERLQALCLQHAVSARDGAIGDLITVVDRWEEESPMAHKFQIGDRVRKVRGASWQGHVCGFYSTAFTSQGYCVESEREQGSVQLYPEAALEPMPTAKEPDLEHQLATAKAALERLKAYAASAWFDESDASDEEREVMEHVRNVLKGK